MYVYVNSKKKTDICLFLLLIYMLKSISQSWLGLTLSAFSTIFKLLFYPLPGHFFCGEIMVKIPKSDGFLGLHGAMSAVLCQDWPSVAVPRRWFFEGFFEARNPETRRDFTGENGD